MNKPTSKANRLPLANHQGRNLRAFLEANGVLFSKLADAISKSPNTVTGYFKTPTLQNTTRTAIAEFLGASQAVIFGLPTIPQPDGEPQSPADLVPDVHQGRRLRTYLWTHGISYAQLGEWLDMQATSIRSYIKQEWLKPQVRREILYQLQTHGYADATALSVFGDWSLLIDADLIRRLALAYQRQRQQNSGMNVGRLLLELHVRLGQLSSQALAQGGKASETGLSQEFIEVAARAMLLSGAVAPQQPQVSPSPTDG